MSAINLMSNQTIKDMIKNLTTIIHLHVHGQRSTLDGLSTEEELAKRAAELGQPAIALTDHGVMGGIPDFIKACKKEGIKPIVGCEAYLTKNRKVQGDGLRKKREELCLKYDIVTGTKKKKPKMKPLQNFLKTVRKDWSKFEEEAHKLLKNYLMKDPELDLFSAMDFSEILSKESKIETFKNEILDYLDHDNFHILLIAINNEGLKDLYQIVSDAHINGFYSDPRTDLSFIRENNLGKNIIATSACLGSYFARLIDQERIEDAKMHIEECKETFHSFYLEKQATRIPKQLKLNEIIDQLAEETNTPKIVTTDVHFSKKDEHDIHDILVAGSYNTCIQDEDRYIYAEDHYIKTIDEVREIVDDDEAIRNTLRIADMVNISLPEKPLLPKAPINNDEDINELLRKQAWNGLFQYILENPEKNYKQYSKQLDYELNVITNMGFADYFIIEEDMINATKRAGFLVGPGRGSAAGSLVAFTTGITDLDPIENKLIFERFLNPERAGYPDIDVDYSYEGARWVQMYLKRKYGKDHVAQIGTFGTLAARASIRFTGKALGKTLEEEDQFAKAIPGKPGTTLKQAYEAEEKVRQLAKMHPDWWEAALKLEGHVRSEGVHAGGIVISPEPLTNTVPLRLDSEGLETTQYDMEWIEKFLVKFDILKLDTLDLIKKTMEFAGIWGKIDINKIDLNDPYVYKEVYNKLNTAGVFQVESEGMKDTIKGLKPNCFEDIGAILALYRPGPMDLIPSYIKRKHGKEKVEYLFPELEQALKETYGIFCYQEQVMECSRIIGGLTRGQSDYGIRKGVAKKKFKLMNRWIDLMIYGTEHYRDHHAEMVKKYPKPENGEWNEKIPLDKDGNPTIWVDYDYDDPKEVPDGIEGGINRGFDEEKLLQLRELWIKFGEYCFNKSHSAAYAKISVQTAWLKAYYPVEFMAALLTISEGKKDENKDAKNIKYMAECENMGISILPPDINESYDNWTPIHDGDRKEIRYGLASISGISSKDFEKIKNVRPFKTFDDFLEDNETYCKLNKGKVINLIKAGAFDSINKNRNKLIKQYLESRREKEADQYPNTTTKKTIIAYEKDMLGVSLTIKSRWERTPDQTETQITGYVRQAEQWQAKSSGKWHWKVVLETQDDEVPALIWGYIIQNTPEAVQIGNKITLKGKKDGDKMITKQVSVIENLMEGV